MSTGSLRAQVVEQVMRMSGDELMVLTFVEAAPQSRAAKVALGRLLASPGARLSLGSPLMAFVTGADVDSSWRSECPSPSGSLWEELGLLCSLHGTSPQDYPCPYDGLLELRSASQGALSY